MVMGLVGATACLGPLSRLVWLGGEAAAFRGSFRGASGIEDVSGSVAVALDLLTNDGALKGFNKPEAEAYGLVT